MQLTTFGRSVHRSNAGRGRRWLVRCSVVVIAAGLATLPLTASANATSTAQPNLGSSVLVFDPSMPTSQIQSAVDAVATSQLSNQFGTKRYSLLFKPGVYGTATEPLNFQVGYYTEVAGLGQNPSDVTINGSVDVRNQCDSSSNCIALNNFWRSLSNLTININNASAGCYAGEFWAVAQGAPMRRVNVTGGNVTLMDYCSGPSFASGGFIADSAFAGGTVINGSQQQFYVRNSTLDGWSNGVWNQVFSGDNGAPAQCFPSVSGCGLYTTLAATPASRERPYLFIDSAGTWKVFVPNAAVNSVGPTWATKATPGHALALSTFYIAKPGDSAAKINKQLKAGRNLLFTPGVYNVNQTLTITRPGTVVLGMGFATLTAVNGVVTMRATDARNVDIAGLIFDAGAKSSPVLLYIGNQHRPVVKGTPPSALQDVFFRIGGPHAGKANVSLRVDANNVIIDDVWAWRADHGTGVGWTANTASTGVIVNGNNVTATGLFVEHYQKSEVIWNGQSGRTVFFQNEMPYDVPNQAAWMNGSQKGYAAYVVGPHVTSHWAWGLGSYSSFNQGVDVFADNAFVVPHVAGVKMHDLLTVFLNTNDKGGILNVINNTGGSSTATNLDVPVTVVNYP